MPRSNLRLTKATRRNIIKNFELLPHQVLEMEQHSLKLRLEDAHKKEQQLLALIEATSGHQDFKHLAKTELPKLLRLIERMTNEIKQLNHDRSYELQLHLYKHDPTIYRHPNEYPSREFPGSEAG